MRTHSPATSPVASVEDLSTQVVDADTLAAAHPALGVWLEASKDAAQRELRAACLEAIVLARARPDDASLVELDLEHLGALELPPAATLNAAGLAAPRLKPTVDFSEPHGLEGLEQSLDALGVRQLAVSRLANGRLPPTSRLDKVQVLDLSMLEGAAALESLLASVSTWPALKRIVPPSHCHDQPPTGWRFDHKRRLERDMDSEATGAAPSGDPAARRMGSFFLDLKRQFSMSSDVPPAILSAHRARLRQAQAGLAGRPDLNGVACQLLDLQEGACVDAALRRLDDLEALLHCGSLSGPDDAGPAALRLALLRRADQEQAFAHRRDGENVEKANALRVLIDQRLSAALNLALPTSSAPVFAAIAGLKSMRPGEAPSGDDWPLALRQASDEVLRKEVVEDYPFVRTLLAEDEGVGALISRALSGDPAHQEAAERIEADFQRDYEAAQTASEQAEAAGQPADPTVGLELHAHKERALAALRFDRLAPWVALLEAALRDTPDTREKRDD